MSKKAIIVTASILLLTLIVASSIAYFVSTKNAGGVIKLAELDFVVNYDGSIDSKNLAKRDYFDAEISLENRRANLSYNGLVGFYMRVYVETYVEDEDVRAFEPVFQDDSKWVMYYDKFYYLEEVKAGDEVNILKGLSVRDSANNDIQGKDCRLEFVVEAVQSSYDAYKSEWPEVPDIY